MARREGEEADVRGNAAAASRYGARRQGKRHGPYAGLRLEDVVEDLMAEKLHPERDA